jgi:hypothetical protein
MDPSVPLARTRNNYTFRKTFTKIHDFSKFLRWFCLYLSVERANEWRPDAVAPHFNARSNHARTPPGPAMVPRKMYIYDQIRTKHGFESLSRSVKTIIFVYASSRVRFGVVDSCVGVPW